NTTAGALNITTRAPSFTPEARAELSVGNYDFVQGKTSISGPITDTLAIRLSTSATTRHGTIYDVASNTDLHRQRNIGFRGQVLYKPSDTLS
ncbi:TonB-dependent receptor, partial [Pseudomonas sp. FW306-02-F04-BA]